MHGRNGGDADSLVDRRSTLVVDPSDDTFDLERLASDAGHHDVRVVTVRDRCERLGTLDTGLAQSRLVETDTLDLLPFEALGQTPEGLRSPVDHRDGMTLFLESGSQTGSDPPTADDDDVHHTPPGSGVEHSGAS